MQDFKDKFESWKHQRITRRSALFAQWYSLKLIPKKVNVKDGFLSPEEYANITPQEVLAKQ